jgi:cell division protein FtsW
MIALQTLIHIAVVTASMPTKGIALPFVSSGGSSLIVSLLGIGILLNIASQTTEESLGQTGQLLPVEPAIGDTVHSRATASAAGSGG